ncbi:MAG TPA: radical SAM family heme chaperone HemW [Chitinophagales bacterium]
MAGIYIHIPFCKQACNYCNFYFVTSLTKKENYVQALLREIELTKDYLQGETVETIYFGGGTPSLLSEKDLAQIFEQIAKFHHLNLQEVTLEANPDDLSVEKLNSLKSSPINRLSIGVQSFFDADLKFMQRAHNANEAEKSIKNAQHSGFENLTIDLIYGTPNLTNEAWIFNLEKANSFGVQHLSCYALTVEPKTKLYQQIKNKEVLKPNDDNASAHFDLLMNFAEANEFLHYEISNFAKPNHLAIHNSNYWKGSKYLGLGAAAHSYNGKNRSWNVANIHNYITEINAEKLPFSAEILTDAEVTNEYIMTSLRTMWGCDFSRINPQHISLISEARKIINPNFYTFENGILKLTKTGKHFADYIASELFIV